MGVNIIHSKIHIFALPMNSTYILITPELRNRIQRLIIENGGVEKIARMLDIDRNYFYNFFKGKRCSLYFIFKIYNNLAIDIRVIEKNLLEVVSGKNNSIGIKHPNLPFNMNNKYGGILLGGIMGDGSRTKLGGITYNNKNELIVRNILESARIIFGDVKYRLTWKKDGTLQLDLPKIVGDVVAMFGIEKSYKTVSDCYVKLPEFSNSFKIHFIRQFFDDEGNVRKTDRRLQIKQTRELKENSAKRIRKNISKYAPRVLLVIKNELAILDIESTLTLEQLRFHNNRVMGDFALNIYCKENLEKFRRKINFTIGYKKALLNEVISNYIFPSAPRNKRIDFALKYTKNVQEKYGFVTKNLLANESARSLKTAAYFLVDLKKRGFVNVIERPRGKKGFPLPQKYMLVNKE